LQHSNFDILELFHTQYYPINSAKQLCNKVMQSDLKLFPSVNFSAMACLPNDIQTGEGRLVYQSQVRLCSTLSPAFLQQELF